MGGSGISLSPGSLRGGAAFYALVALEFFYMVSPFAVYLCGIYGPGLERLGSLGITTGLVPFFLPHIYG